MKDFAMTISLKNDPDVIRTYKEFHTHVWHEVTTSLKAVGIHDMKIFLLGRRLFMTMTTSDDFNPAKDFPTYLTLHPKCREWEDLMDTMQEKVPEAKAHEKWALMEKIFQL
ncbi:MAG: L-rhamnose mutarotase [Ignavibacteria bacterium]|nr:L-rhamnose mutarotase [Ignavibacteria bacterium]MBI3766030.1 L-rhamnose mutarotase [Ignavibacteriales bacterium]